MCKKKNLLIVTLWLSAFNLMGVSFYAQASDDLKQTNSEPKISEPKVLTFGIVPQQSALILAKKWLPIFHYLGEKTGYKFEFKTTKTIPEFERNVLNQAYDFAYMNPYHYTVFHKSSGYEAILKQGQKQIVGIMVARKDANINNLQDLQGKTLAFPAPAAFAATVIPQTVMDSMNIQYQSKYVASHESVYKNIAYGNFVAGGGIERTFLNSDSEIRNQLKIFWRSKGYTPHAIAYSPIVNKEIALKVQKAFLEMNHSKEGKKLLAELKFKTIEAAVNSDWDDVRGLGIKTLENMNKTSKFNAKNVHTALAGQPHDSWAR